MLAGCGRPRGAAEQVDLCGGLEGATGAGAAVDEKCGVDLYTLIYICKYGYICIYVIIFIYMYRCNFMCIYIYACICI